MVGIRLRKEVVVKYSTGDARYSQVLAEGGVSESYQHASKYVLVVLGYLVLQLGADL